MLKGIKVSVSGKQLKGKRDFRHIKSNSFHVNSKLNDINRLGGNHFYEERIQRYMDRKPTPVTLSQLVKFGSNLTLQKILTAGRYVGQELTTRFAHRSRQMQLLPYRLMGQPALLKRYEQHIESFYLLDSLPKIRTMDGNLQLLDICRQVSQIDHGSMTETVSNARQITEYRHKAEDPMILDTLVRTLITSRLSRHVLADQQRSLTEYWRGGKNRPNHVGTVRLNCTMHEALLEAEAIARTYLPDNAPLVEIEGSEDDLHYPFPYIWTHLIFPLGHLLINSMEGCLRNNVSAPIKVTVGGTDDIITVRISDNGGGIDPRTEQNLWNFVSNQIHSDKIGNANLSGNPFYNLVYGDEISNDKTSVPTTSHLRLGLPLSKIYVDYWGGSLEICSIEGFGCDVSMKISRTGGIGENLLL